MADMKRILYIHHTTGFSGSVLSLSMILRSLDRKEYEPYLIIPGPGGAADFLRKYCDNLTVLPLRISMHHMRPFHIYNLREWMKWLLGFLPDRTLMKVIREIDPVLVHLNASYLISAGMSAKRLGYPLVWHVREIIPKATIGFRRACIRHVIKKLAEEVLFIGEEERKVFKGRVHGTVIYNAVDFNQIKDAKKDTHSISEIEGINDPSIKVAQIGYLSEEKGTFSFIGLIPKIRNGIGATKVVYFLVGNAANAQALERARETIRKVGTNEKIVITGFVKEIFSFMSKMDIIVFLSRQENISRPPIEAQALGKPVVVNCPDRNTGLVVHGKTGYIVVDTSLDEAIMFVARLINNPDLRQQMGKDGAQYAEKTFDCNVQIKKITAIYEKALLS